MIEPDDLDAVLVKNWVTRFIDRHPDLDAKFSSAFDNKPIKASDASVIIDCELSGVIRKLNISGYMWFNMDQKGFMTGKSER